MPRKEVEEFAAMITAYQDTGQNPFLKEKATRTADTEISLPTYQKYWIHDKSYGHDIVIWSDTGKLTIKCIWPTRRRSDDGRVSKKESSCETIANTPLPKKSNSK